MWTIAKGISTPRGTYVPTSDDLKEELIKAARFAGLTNFNVKLNGNYVEENELQTNSIAALVDGIAIESVEVEANDQAA